MNYWLVKSEPFKYSWDDFVKEGKSIWDGVRNYQARNNMKEMKKGDWVFFYHSNEGMEVIGLAEVNKELKDFAHIVSHDLKAPLRAIKNIATWLSEDYKDKIDVKGNVILAKYFVYIEVYDFSVSEDEVVKVNGQQTTTQTTRLGLQIKFVDAETSQVIVGSGLGEASTVKTSTILGDISDDVKFNQSTISIATKKALDIACARILDRMVKKGIFEK